MSRTGSRGKLLRKTTATGLALVVVLAGLPPTAAAAGSCKGWKTQKFFESATLEQVTACLSAGEDPNEPDNRDRGEPHGSAPPTPPGIRVRTTAVRRI